MRTIVFNCILAVMLVFSGNAFGAEAKWIPVEDGIDNCLQLGYTKARFNFGGNEFEHFFQVRSNCRKEVSVEIEIDVDSSNKKHDSISTKINPGETKKSGGWWTICRSVQSARIKARPIRGDSYPKNLTFSGPKKTTTETEKLNEEEKKGKKGIESKKRKKTREDELYECRNIARMNEEECIAKGEYLDKCEEKRKAEEWKCKVKYQ
jgi:hypothetical protein